MNETYVISILAMGLILLLFAAIYFLWRVVITRDRQRAEPSRPGISLAGGRYTIAYELGRGLNAVAFRVHENSDPEEPLVAKILLTPDDEPRVTPSSFRRHVERFQREMRNLEKLQHSRFVVPVEAFHPEALHPFYVMKYCEGSLESRLRNGPLLMNEIYEVLVDVCRGLADSHAEGIIHRDLKPANILRYEERWVLADFGMSLIGNEGSVVTVPESMPGTIPYTAPEVMYLRPESIGPTADIFSLGVTIKEMLVGSSVWEDKPSNLVQFGRQSRRKHVEKFDSLIEKMMRFSSGERPANLNEVAVKLNDIFEYVGLEKASDWVKYTEKAIRKRL